MWIVQKEDQEGVPSILYSAYVLEVLHPFDIGQTSSFTVSQEKNGVN